MKLTEIKTLSKEAVMRAVIIGLTKVFPKIEKLTHVDKQNPELTWK